VSKSTHKPRHNTCSKCHPRTNSAPASERDRITNNLQTPYFRTHSRRALFDLPQTLHGSRARRAHHKRCETFFDLIHSFSARSVVKVVLWSRGAHLTKPGWSKPHTHSNRTNLALFRHKITLYRFNQGLILLQGGSNWSRGLSPPSPPHFNHWLGGKMLIFGYWVKKYWQVAVKKTETSPICRAEMG